MEVDLVDRHIMNAGFGMTKQLEGPDSRLLDRTLQGGTLDDGSDFGQRTPVNMTMFVRLVLMGVVFRFVGVTCVMGVRMSGFMEVLRPGLD
jgi:hypothetical protein